LFAYSPGDHGISGDGMINTGGGVDGLKRNIYATRTQTIATPRPLRTRPIIDMPFDMFSPSSLMILLSAISDTTKPAKPRIQPPNAMNNTVKPAARGPASSYLLKSYRKE
jgi:hypothetical protein